MEEVKLILDVARIVLDIVLIALIVKSIWDKGREEE